MQSSKIIAGVALTSTILTVHLAAYAQDHPAPVQFLESEGVRIIKSFDAPAQLKGYIAEYQNRPVELYVTADGEYAILGTLINAQGDAVSQSHRQDSSSGAIDWSTLESTHWIAEGDTKAAHIVYVFTDPNCPFCARFWEAAQPYLARGGVQLRHIMVGILRESSADKAATVLAARNRDEARQLLAYSMEHTDMPTSGNIPSEAQQQVLQNNVFMQQHSIFGTPTVVFKDPDGAVQLAQGLPSEYLMENFIFGPSSGQD